MILSVDRVSFRYNGSPVLRDVSFHLPEGKILGVLGVNGAGKSTLLKCVNRVLKPNGGVVMVDGEDLVALSGDEVARRIGYAPQRYPTERLTVFDAVLLGRKPHIKWMATDHDMLVVERSLASMGLEGHALRPVSTLSGGEAQKVVIARALAQEPRVLLLDEPTSNLDLRNQLDVMTLVSNIVKRDHVSAVTAIHDLNLALRFADLFLTLKDGAVHSFGPIEELTPEVVAEVYGVRSVLREIEGFPVIVPVSCHCDASSRGASN